MIISQNKRQNSRKHTISHTIKIRNTYVLQIPTCLSRCNSKIAKKNPKTNNTSPPENGAFNIFNPKWKVIWTNHQPSISFFPTVSFKVTGHTGPHPSNKTNTQRSQDRWLTISHKFIIGPKKSTFFKVDNYGVTPSHPLPPKKNNQHPFLNEPGIKCCPVKSWIKVTPAWAKDEEGSLGDTQLMKEQT